MTLNLKSLRELSFALRVAATCLVLVMMLGYAASLYFVTQHVGRKDGEKGVSGLDLVGTYHGVKKPAPIVTALTGETHRAWLADMPKDDFALLLRWTEGKLSSAADPIAAAYLEPPPGAPEDTMVPADVLDVHCGRCHSPDAKEGDGIGARVSLKRWPQVAPHAYTKELDPISVDILAQSTHAHALSMPTFAAVLAALALLTRFSRRLRHTVVLLIFFGLFLDLFGMWAGRWHPAFIYGGVVLGGALFGLGLGLSMAVILIDLWWPSPQRKSNAA